MGTYYSYNCQVCGKRQTGKSKVRRCKYCQITMCWRCSSHGFCPTHDRDLLGAEKSKLKTAHFFESQMCCFGCIALIASIALGFMLSMPTNSYGNLDPSMFGLFIGIGIVSSCIITIGSNKLGKSMRNSAGEMINKRKMGSSQSYPVPSYSSNDYSFPTSSPPALDGIFSTDPPQKSPASDRFCPTCQKTRSGEHIFCPDCGYKL